MGDLEAFVELVRVELIRREDPESLVVHLDDLGNVGSDPGYQLTRDEETQSLRLHVGDGLVGGVTVVFPAWSLERGEASVGLLSDQSSSLHEARSRTSTIPIRRFWSLGMILRAFSSMTASAEAPMA